MEELQKRHRQEQKDLQSRVTQKKKSATKKTRKGVNDECAELERMLKERQLSELTQSVGEPQGDEQGPLPEPAGILSKVTETNGEFTASLSILDTPEVNGHVKRPNRQKARQARRAAEQEAAIEKAAKETTNLPNLRDKEIQTMREAYQSRGLKEQDIRSDGHCLYAAVADQLVDASLGLKPSIKLEIDLSEAVGYVTTRQVAASYILSHSDDFEPFIEGSLELYVKTIQETGEWGGHLELLALAKAYGVNINVLQRDGKVEIIESGAEKPGNSLWLAYYRHSYGLGEHYNSLRRAR
ncbi:MAG: hypothetical protein Q9164_001237 [Protoblastenia rupestris]